MDKEYFDEMLLALRQITDAIAEASRKMKVLNMKRTNDVVEEEKDRIRHLINDLHARKDKIIEVLEKEFCDTQDNIKRFSDGQSGMKMTNPITNEVFLVYPNNEQVALYYILLLEKRIANKMQICRSDYIEMEEYFKRDKCEYPKELFLFIEEE